MGLIPSINGDLIKLAERAVTALERLADAAEAPSARPSAEVTGASTTHVCGWVGGDAGVILTSQCAACVAGTEPDITPLDAVARCMFCGRPGGVCAADECDDVITARAERRSRRADPANYPPFGSGR